MNIAVLSTELTTDELERGYSEMSDAEAAADLNTVYRTRNKTSMTGDEVFGATDATEFAALTDAKQQMWISFCGKDSIDPTGTANIAFLQWVFGVGSDTGSALLALRAESISRAVELGLGEVRVGDVERARA